MGASQEQRLALARYVLGMIESIQQAVYEDAGKHWHDIYQDSKPLVRETIEGLRALQQYYSSHVKHFDQIKRKLDSLSTASKSQHLLLHNWCRKFRVAAENLPTHCQLVEQILHHFQDHVYHPFLATRHLYDHPDFARMMTRLDMLETEAQRVYDMAYTAHEVVQEFVDSYPELCNALPPHMSLLPGAGSPAESRYGERKPTDARKAVPSSAPATASSFSCIEEVINKGHTRAATEAPHYTTDETAKMAWMPQLGSVRRSGRTPRVFTGSFSELEQSFHSMQLHASHANQGEELDSATSEPVWVKAFVESLASSTSPEPDSAQSTDAEDPENNMDLSCAVAN